jgi:hypothetical protein
MRPIQIVQQHTDHLATWLTFVGAFFGAIIVAIIAAVTAQKRLTAQLESEERRHREQLASEERRQREQIDFDRGEADRRELRSILDALAEQLLQLEDAASSAYSDARTYSRRSGSEGAGEQATRKVRASAGRLYDERRKLAGHITRLRLRLGAWGRDLDKAAMKAQLASGSLVSSLNEHDPPYDEEELLNMSSDNANIWQTNMDFMRGALRYTQARLLKEPTDAPDGQEAEDDESAEPISSDDA